jgi:uncharacterized protein with PQ loop repeat
LDEVNCSTDPGRVFCVSPPHLNRPDALSAERTTMHWNLPDTVGLLGTILAFLTVAPQVTALRHTASAAGVSLTALANSLVSGVAWTTFGVTRHDVWIALPSAVTVPPTVAALYLGWIRSSRREPLWMPLGWAAALLTVAVSGLWLGTGPIAAALGGSVMLLVGPAVWSVWHSSDVSAVAASAWQWLIVEASLTGAYGALVHVPANLLYAGVAITGSSAILVGIAVVGRRTHLARLADTWRGLVDADLLDALAP